MIDGTQRRLPGLLTVGDAAMRLGVTRGRVQHLIKAGDLDAKRVGGIWLIDEDSIERRLARQPAAGRSLTPASAWGLIFLADGLVPEWLDRHDRWRLRRFLPRLRSGELAARMVERGRRRHLRGHPGLLARFREDPALMLTGVSASEPLRLGLIGGMDTVEAYVDEDALDGLMRRHHLQPTDSPNVVLRVIPKFGWSREGLRVAPRSAVALDLLDDLEPRARQVGSDLLREIPS